MCQQVNRNFSLDQNQFSPQYSSGDSNVIQMDSSALYGTPSILQGSSMSSFPYATNNYGLLNSNNELNMNMPCNTWSNNKVPQFLMRNSPPKQSSTNNQLHFTNNTPFWNASEAPNSIKDVRSSFFPSLQPQFSTPNFDSHSKVLH